MRLDFGFNSVYKIYMLKVNVDFVGSKIIPISFVADGREHLIERIALQYWRKDGDRKYLCFSISTSGTNTELTWDTQSFVWKITGQEPSSI